MGLKTTVPDAGDRARQGSDTPADNLRRTLVYLRDCGYHFAEFGVGMVDESVPDDEYEALRSAVKDAGIPVLAFNAFIPARLKITGPDVDFDALKRYVSKAIERISGIGGQIIVFGSGAARSVPDGWPMETAMDQVKRFVEMAGDAAAAKGIVIAIEHLRREETNVLNSLASALQLAREVDHPSVRLLVDLYHLDVEGESFQSIADAGEMLVHAHVADTGRLYPGRGQADLAGFVGTLRNAGYDAGISVECRWGDFAAESREAAKVLLELISSD